MVKLELVLNDGLGDYCFADIYTEHILIRIDNGEKI